MSETFGRYGSGELPPKRRPLRLIFMLAVVAPLLVSILASLLVLLITTWISTDSASTSRLLGDNAAFAILSAGFSLLFGAVPGLLVALVIIGATTIGRKVGLLWFAALAFAAAFVPLFLLLVGDTKFIGNKPEYTGFAVLMGVFAAFVALVLAKLGARLGIDAYVSA